jgi:predicted unusual protein kinase regulating ubiquinone biosynthesis (AarF/ABC1/UbiB family)
MIFTDGDFHADPHPGNLLVRDDGGVVFIDFGAAGRLSPAMRAGVPRLLDAVLRRDRAATLAALQQMGFVQRRPGDRVAERVIDYLEARFIQGLDAEAWKLGDLHFDAGMKLEMMADLRRLDLLMGDLTATFQVPREWILLLRTLILLLGVCTALDPAMRPLATVRPYLEKLALGEEGDWLGLAARLARDLALAAVALPGDLRRLLAKADRGELEVEARGLRDGAVLLYALGHQLLCGLFALGSAGLGYAAYARGDLGIATALAWVSGACLLGLAASLWRARRWQRSLRRGAR